jgi:hypothetical protein
MCQNKYVTENGKKSVTHFIGMASVVEALRAKTARSRATVLEDIVVKIRR